MVACALHASVLQWFRVDVDARAMSVAQPATCLETCASTFRKGMIRCGIIASSIICLPAALQDCIGFDAGAKPARSGSGRRGDARPLPTCVRTRRRRGAFASLSSMSNSAAARAKSPRPQPGTARCTHFTTRSFAEAKMVGGSSVECTFRCSIIGSSAAT